jgi:hypothetical protein
MRAQGKVITRVFCLAGQGIIKCVIGFRLDGRTNNGGV